MAPDRQALEITDKAGRDLFHGGRSIRQARPLSRIVVEGLTRSEHRYFALQVIDQVQRAHDAVHKVRVMHSVGNRLREGEADLSSLSR